VAYDLVSLNFVDSLILSETLRNHFVIYGIGSMMKWAVILNTTLSTENAPWLFNKQYIIKTKDDLTIPRTTVAHDPLQLSKIHVL